MTPHIASNDTRLARLLADAGDIFLGIEDRQALAQGQGVICLAAQLAPGGRPLIGFSFTRDADIDDVVVLFPSGNKTAHSQA